MFAEKRARSRVDSKWLNTKPARSTHTFPHRSFAAGTQLAPMCRGGTTRHRGPGERRVDQLPTEEESKPNVRMGVYLKRVPASASAARGTVSLP